MFTGVRGEKEAGRGPWTLYAFRDGVPVARVVGPQSGEWNDEAKALVEAIFPKSDPVRAVMALHASRSFDTAFRMTWSPA